jgi:peptidoglycan/LPS O-acetylase OafA/YrhL
MYFLFPLISELAHVRRPIIMISATFVIACSLGLLVHSTGKNDHPLDYHDYFEPQAIARGAIGFMLGALIRGAEVHSRFKWFVSRIWTLPASTAVVAVLLSTPGTDYISVLSFPLLVSAIANVNLEYCGNVPSRMLAAAGGLSYSVYLIHDQLHTTRTFINEVLTSTPTTSSYMMYLLFSFVVLYAIAGIIYVLVEQPARTLIVRLASSHKTSHKGSPTAMFPQMSNIVSSYQRIRIGGGATRRLHLTLWRGAVVWIRSDY